jgi:hypothetical protein
MAPILFPSRWSRTNFLLGLFIISFLDLKGQINEWSSLPSIDAYYTTLKIDRYSYSTGLNPDEKYFENSINLSLSAPISQKLRGGMQFMTIATKVLREPVDRSYAAGLFLQYNFRARKRLGVYFEGGYTISNLCPCGEAEAYTSDSLNHFLQFGLGLNYKITDRFHLKAGLINYSPLVEHSDIYNWTQPFIGLKYHFLQNYDTPLNSRFRERTPKIPKEELSLYWQDENSRKWNIGLSSGGVVFTQHNSVSGQTGPLIRYREFIVTPRVNYWINQAVLVGVQGTYYHYENNLDTIPKTKGFGTGLQARFYPLSFKNPAEYRAFRIGRRGNWNIAPIVGAEVHAANYSWQDPYNARQKWQYFDFQPYGGFELSYKQWFNLFWGAGPVLGANDQNEVYPSGMRIIGFEYNFYE